MWSAGYVSLAGIFGILGLSLLAVSVLTQHWEEHYVNREQILALISQNQSLESELDSVNTSALFYSRSYGIFRQCFYHNEFPGQPNENNSLNDNCREYASIEVLYGDNERNWIIRQNYIQAQYDLLTIGLGLTVFTILFNVVFFCLLCTNGRSATPLVWVGCFYFLSVITLCTSGGMYHFAKSAENRLKVHPFQSSWHFILKTYHQTYPGWSYSCYWFGIFNILIAAVSIFIGYFIAKKEYEDGRKEKATNAVMRFFDEMMFENVYPEVPPQMPAPYVKPQPKVHPSLPRCPPISSGMVINP